MTTSTQVKSGISELNSRTPICQSQPAAYDHDTVRGVLILLVMLDHNDIIRNVKLMNDVFKPLTFHVAAFLVLPFLTAPKRISLGMVIDRAIRYLVPFLCALLGYALAYQLIYQGSMPNSQWLRNLGWAFLSADPWSIQASTGFVALWFLPALLSTVLLAAFFNSSSPWGKAALLLFTLTIHFSIGASSVELRKAIPQGLLIAFYILPFGLLVQYIMPLLQARAKRAWITALCLIILSLTWVFESGTEIEIATLELPTLARPLWVIATDLGNFTALAALLVCSPLLRFIPGLGMLGKHSLLVYLFHPILYKPIFGVLLPYCKLSDLSSFTGSAKYWACAVVSVVLAAALSIGGAIVIQRSFWLRTTVTPRTFKEWSPMVILSSIRSGRL